MKIPLTKSEKKLKLKTQFADDGVYKITIPEPFKFHERDRKRKLRKGIRQRWLEKTLADKRYEEDKMINYRFKANPIPKTTSEPRFEMINAAEKQRRELVKKQSIAMTLANEKPFSFYQRDKDFYKRREEEVASRVEDVMKDIQSFKATPIPESVTARNFTEMVQKGENERQERIKNRAKELYSISRLPPRMEMHEKDKDNGKQLIKKYAPDYTFLPPRAREVPDFKAQQDAFQKTLEKHKRAKQLTIAKPFCFRETKKMAKIREFMDLNNIPRVKNSRPVKTEKISALAKPSINPPSTLKMATTMEMKRKNLEEKIKHKEELLLIEKERAIRLNRLAPEVRAHIVDNKEKLKMQAEEKLKNAKEMVLRREQEYELFKKAMEESVNKRPLLMVQTAGESSSFVNEDIKKSSEIIVEADLPESENEEDGSEGNQEDQQE